MSVPDADVLSKIADILDTKVSILLGGTIPDEDDNDVIAEQLNLQKSVNRWQLRIGVAKKFGKLLGLYS